jgi:hypothetical protein
MAYPTITEADGALSATGMAKEASGAYGVPVLPTTFLPDTGNTMEVDPGWFSPSLMMGLRDRNVYNLQGEEKHAGAIDGPLFPSNGMAMMVAAIGADNVAGAGIVGTASTGSTTLSGGVSAGASTITLASATGFATGNIIQLDVNGSGPTTTAECRKITLSGTTATLDQPLTYAHLTGVAIIGVVAPFTHKVQQANTLPSLTVERNIGGRQSQQWAGCKVNKFDLKAPVSNEPCAVTADMMAQSVAILDSPSAISIANETPFVFAEASVSFYGASRSEAANVNVSIDNMIKDTYTYSGQHGPSFLTATQLHVSGTLDMVWSSLDDATYGDFNRMLNQTTGALTVTLAHPASAGSIAVTMPQIVLVKDPIELKSDSVVMQALSWEASRPLSGGSQFTVQATVINSAYLPY